MTHALPKPSGCMKSPSLLDRCSALRLGRNNLFDVIRLYAAIQVLIVHGVAHLHFIPPLLVQTFFSLPGVPLFFSISGFLVGLSSLRFRGRWGEYAWHRFLRIFPALWICLLVSILVLITFGKGWFFLSPAGFVWLASQLTVVQFFNPSQLRDFGVGVINGSLWTIPVELQFYVVLPALVVVAGALRDRAVVLLLSAIILCSFFIRQVLIGSLIDPESLAAKLLDVSFAPHLFQFLLGFACLLPYLFLGRKRSVLVLIVAGLASLAASTMFPVAGSFLRPVAFAALPVGVGLIPLDLLRGLDFSYGLYLYHMPIANALLVAKVPPGLSVPIYLLFSFVIAALSWFLVEKPALSLKSKIPAIRLKSLWLS